jgi:hypothetical protein
MQKLQIAMTSSPILDTKGWRSVWAVTLTIKKCLETPVAVVPCSEMECKAAFNRFMHMLNERVYRNAYKRYGKRLRVLPVLERGELDGRYHFQISIEPPAHLDPDQFEELLRSCWYGKVYWANERVDVNRSGNGTWTKYCLKQDQKSYCESLLDSVDLDNLYNPSLAKAA